MAWNKPRENATPPARNGGMKTLVSCAVCGGIVLVITLCFVLPFGKKPDKSKVVSSEKVRMIEQPTPKRALPSVTSNAVAVSANEVRSPIKLPKTPVGNVVTQVSNAGRVEYRRDGSIVTNRAVVVFKRPFERSLQVALRPGGFGASAIQSLLHRYSESQILDMLKEITRPEPDDDENVAALKNRVQKLKEDVLLEVANGRSAKEVLEELRRQCATEQGLRRDVDKTMRIAAQSGDAKSVRDALKKTNDMLEKKGMPARRAPVQYRKQIEELEAEEKAERLKNTDELNKAIEQSVQ